MVLKKHHNALAVPPVSTAREVPSQRRTNATQATTVTLEPLCPTNQALSAHQVTSANKAPSFPLLVQMVFTLLEVLKWKVIALIV